MRRSISLGLVAVVGCVVAAHTGIIAIGQESHDDGQKTKPSGRTVVAEVVALDQPILVSRLGANVPQGKVYALRTDVMTKDDPKSLYFCTQHGYPMRGMLGVSERPAPPKPPGPGDPKTIVITGETGPNRWSVTVNGQQQTGSDVTVNAGDSIVWDVLTGRHGIGFHSEAAAKAVLTFTPVSGHVLENFPGPFNAPGAGPASGWGTKPINGSGTPIRIAAATVNQGVQNQTLNYFCTQHGVNMEGNLTVGGASKNIVIIGETGPNRWAVEVDGTPQSGSDVTVSEGDSITWEVKSGHHGIGFHSKAAAEAVLTFTPVPGHVLEDFPAAFPQPPAGPATGWGTKPITPPGNTPVKIAEAKVKAGVGNTTLNYFCTQHGINMQGNLMGGGSAKKIVITGETGPNRWAVTVNGTAVQGSDVSISAGDSITWDVKSGHHGIGFHSKEEAEKVLAFKDVPGHVLENFPAAFPQPPAGPATGWGTKPITPPGNTPVKIAEATVKAGVARTSLNYFCTQHGVNMQGNLNAGIKHIVISGENASGGGHVWKVNGQPSSDVTVSSGDKITWQVASGTHGVGFNSQADAEKMLTFEAVPGHELQKFPGPFPAPGAGPSSGWGTKPVSAPAPVPPAKNSVPVVIAKATVKPGVTNQNILLYFCTQHGLNMRGNLAGPGKPGGPRNITVTGFIGSQGPHWEVAIDGHTKTGTYIHAYPDDTITWQVEQGTHGVGFLNEASATRFLKFTSGDLEELVDGVVPGLGAPKGPEVAYGTVPINKIGVIAKATVKDDAAIKKAKAEFANKDLPPYRPGENLAEYTGNVTLKPYKRPRPIALRSNVGDVLEIRFSNLIEGSNSRFVGCHVTGMNLLDTDSENTSVQKSIGGAPSLFSDSSYVGLNANSFANHRRETMLYRYYASAQGEFIIYSSAQPQTISEIGDGLFGTVTVQPPTAEYYRSQVTRRDLFYSSYYTKRLPPEVLLHKGPSVENGKLDLVLTTFKTRLRKHEIRNARVKVKTADFWLLGENPETDKFYERDLETNKEKKSFKAMPEKVGDLDMEAAERLGTIVPVGYLFSALGDQANPTDWGKDHPVLDYSAIYKAPPKNSKPENYRKIGTPILRMLYPVATKILSATEAGELPRMGKVKKGAEAYTLGAKDIQVYDDQVFQLDNGRIPLELKGLLKFWGVTVTPAATVAPELGFVSRIGVEADPTYLWILDGVQLPGSDYKFSSILIQGEKLTDGGKVTGGKLQFFAAELQLFHSDQTAIITGPRAGEFRLRENPSFYKVPAIPNRRQPYREFVFGYHNPEVAQAFYPQQQSGDPGGTLPGQPKPGTSPLSGIFKNQGLDKFGINYGIGGIGTEIYANRVHVGPEGVNQDGVDLKFEEFFLSAWAVGDPAMVVDTPANATEAAPPLAELKDVVTTSRATKVFYPDDPSNVYHSYMRDHVKFRIYNAGIQAPHVHHLHAHQWLHSSNSDNGHYLDSQLITPGSTYTLEMVYNGSGNRNQTVGDSIFHCHFYPHFAQGMWALWRVHDVFEAGTLLQENDWRVPLSDPKSKNPLKKWVRALPDGEIHSGAPIPAIVPLPTLGMAPFPVDVRVTTLPPAEDPAGGNIDEIKAWVNIDRIDASDEVKAAWPEYLGKKNEGVPISLGRVAEVKPEYRYKREKGVVVRTKDKWKLPEPVEPKEFYLGPDGEPHYRNPGFPFFVPGIAGHRPPHPPLDLAYEEDAPGVPKLDKDGNLIYLDGGLPRHGVLGGEIVREFHTRWDFSKDFITYPEKPGGGEDRSKGNAGAFVAYQIPEKGTAIEKGAMRAHATRTRETVLPSGEPGVFILNGLPPIHGAPYADPGVDDDGNSTRDNRRYRVAVVQDDVILNKQGWHYPQQRFITLWEDVKPTLNDDSRPPQPFFFRANGGETIMLWHTNLVPDYYQLDDFQVRTPTDVIGQHIHLVKFDVTSSDGAENGFNYEDGTFSPNEVTGRIRGINRAWLAGAKGKYGLFQFNHTVGEGGQSVNWSKFIEGQLEPTKWDGSYTQWKMTAPKIPYEDFLKIPKNERTLPPKYQDWDGAQTTIQRYDTDPLFNNKGIDRTVRTVFTHDHFGPSTHQQAGLYAGLLVEPTDSTWRDPITNALLYDPVAREDGGPTGWQAIIVMPDESESYREFALEFQDLALAYTKDSRKDKDTGIPTLGKFLLTQQNVFTATMTTSKMKPGPVPDALKKQFTNNKINLSEKAELTADGANFEVVDPEIGPGKEPAYFLEKTQTLPKTKQTQYNVKTRKVEPSLFTAKNVEAKAGPVDTDLKNRFAENGIVLSDKATLSVPGGGRVLELTDPVNYFYGDDEPAFRLVRTLSAGSKDYDVNTLHLETYADPTHAIGAPNSGLDSKNPKVTQNELPAPQLVSGGPNGTYTVNYRNEPLPLRVDPNLAKGGKNVHDLAWAYSSIPRGPNLDVQVDPPSFSHDQASLFPDGQHPFKEINLYSGNNQAKNGKVANTDPFTPILRAYQNDRVQIRTLVGAHTKMHALNIHGVKWLFEPSYMESGYRATQGMGISEHFEMVFQLPPASTTDKQPFADYLYAPSSGSTGQTNGVWGIMRAYDATDANPLVNPIPNLVRLPEAANARPYQEKLKRTQFPEKVEGATTFTVEAKQPVPDSASGHKELLYNTAGYNGGTILKNKNGIVFDLTHVDGEPNDVTPFENYMPPMIARAAAGDWIEVTLKNTINHKYKPPTSAGAPFGRAQAAGMTPPVPAVTLTTSNTVGLNPQYVSYDIRTSDGSNVGFNPSSTVAAPKSPESPTSGSYLWYAGDFKTDKFGNLLNAAGEPVTGDEVPIGHPVESGAVNLAPPDPILQHTQGLVGALIVEPTFADWEVINEPGVARLDNNGVTVSAVKTTNSPGAMATVNTVDEEGNETEFVEIVLIAQNDPIVTGAGGAYALNHTTEPFTNRPPNQGYDVMSDAVVGTPAKQKIVISGDQSTTTDSKGNKTTKHFWSVTVNGNAISGSSLAVGPGDTITWDVKSGTHGIGFNSKDEAEQFLDFTPVPGHPLVDFPTPSFPAPGAGPSKGWGTKPIGVNSGDPVKIAEATVKGIRTRSLLYFCTQHGLNMKGYLGVRGYIDPQTPVFAVKAGTPLRIRLLMPGGNAEPGPAPMFELHGHSWQEEPYVEQSTKLGNNILSQVFGTQLQVPNQSLNLLIDKAGGEFETPGDYLYRYFTNDKNGGWGILRVLSNEEN